MPRIAGIDVPAEKTTWCALTYIHGIGKAAALQICKEAQVHADGRMKTLTDDEIGRIAAVIDRSYVVEGALRRQVLQNIARLRDITCYRGTRHRRGLTPLRPVTSALARRVIAGVERRQRRNLAIRRTRLHFAADEFYLLAGSELPPLSAYEDLPQLENGVGMVRRFEHELRGVRRLLPPAERRRARAVVATGTRFAPLLEARLGRRLRDTGEAAAWRVEVVPVRNRLFGASVNVAGLLGGAEVITALRCALPFDCALLPPEMLNADRLTLDGLHLNEIARRLGQPVQVGLGRRAPLAG